MPLSMAFPPGVGPVDDTPVKGWSWWYGADYIPRYECGIDDDIEYHGHKCVYIRSVDDRPAYLPGPPFYSATVMQFIAADQYCGKRVKFSAAIKTDAVDGSAYVVMMVTAPAHEVVSYDFMEGRNISGITDWKRVDVVLDVPMASLQIIVGVAIAEKGQIWASDLRFEETNHPTTGVRLLQDGPMNFNFTE